MRNTPTLYVVIGLPSAGKTTLCKQWKKDGKIKDFCDDYQNNPEKKYKEPEKSPHYKHLVKGLLNGDDWAINDIRYCDPRERRILSKALRKALPILKIKYVFFENNPDICESNLVIRAKGVRNYEKNLIFYYTELYQIPKPAKALPVYQL